MFVNGTWKLWTELRSYFEKKKTMVKCVYMYVWVYSIWNLKCVYVNDVFVWVCMRIFGGQQWK